MEAKPFPWRKFLLWLLGCGLVAAAALCAWRFWPRPEPEGLDVPLGVEQAAIVTYSGPPVVVAPYKWGVAVNVRIAGMEERPGTRVYDVRYLVNREGTFDLKDYLIAANGSPLTGLPSFKFHGDAKLSKNLETRVQETEEVHVQIRAYYEETLAALAAVWVIWLLLLIFYKRPGPPPPPDPVFPEPTLAEKLRAFLIPLRAGTLDAADKARLEMLLLRCWRSRLGLEGERMETSLAAIGREQSAGPALQQLQDWLHHPRSSITREQIAAVIDACAAEPTPAPAPLQP